MFPLLIPTKFKEKLPVGFSYPIGAQAISEALKFTPQYSQLGLSFYWKDEFRTSSYATKIKAGGEIRVIEAHYTPTWNEWKLAIRAVPGTEAAAAREVLTTTALPELAECLSQIGLVSDFFSKRAKYCLKTQRVNWEG
jgi:hypothetical protein